VKKKKKTVLPSRNVEDETYSFVNTTKQQSTNQSRMLGVSGAGSASHFGDSTLSNLAKEYPT